MIRRTMLLTSCLLFCCACTDNSTAHTDISGMHKPAQEQSVMTPSPIRVIIYFTNATTSNPALDRAVSDACRCQAVFLRQYRDNALIYEVALQQDQTFASFRQVLLTKGGALNIQAIEQDALMRHQ